MLIIIHVLAGCIALLSGSVASFTHRNIRLHKKAGLTYVASIVVIVVSAILLSLQTGKIFFLAISFFALYFMLRGWAMARNRYLKKQWAYVFLGTGLVLTLTFLGFSLLLLVNGKMFSVVPLMFAGIMGSFVVVDYRHFIIGVKSSTWLYHHIISMGAAFISTVTPFLLINRFGLSVPDWIFWTLPTVVGSLLITRAVRKYAPR